MKLAIVGASGLVGRKMIALIHELNVPYSELIVCASNHSIGTHITYKNKTFVLISILDAIQQHPQIALFSAGSDVALNYAPLFEKVGSFVIDNSSAFRMHPNHLLIVPEVNAHEITASSNKIISNPNCSTIQLVLVLNALYNINPIKKIVISTYQSVTGSGKKAYNQLHEESKGNNEVEKVYPHPIFNNCIPHCDVFLESGFTKEEMKLMTEPKKIMNKSFEINATAVRVPVTGGHSESVYICFEQEADLGKIIKTLESSKGIIVEDDITKNVYPMPIKAHNKDDVFVGRIRKDIHNKNAISLWIVSDNLRKGAATNSVQIAKCIIDKGLA